MAYNWLKWFHGAVADDKWPLIARKSGQPVAVVVAVWAALLECASQAEDRGSIEDFDAESMDAVLQISEGACAAIVEALSTGKRPRIVDGRINNWEKRQEEPQQSSSTERVRRFRERKRAHNAGDEATCNAGETPETACNDDETFHPVSCNADETLKRPDNKTRDNKNNINTLPLPLTGEGDADSCDEHTPPAESRNPLRGTREDGTNPRAAGTNPRAKGTNPRSIGDNPREQRKPTGNTAPELRQAIADFTPSEPLRKALEDFRAMRERIRKPLTGRALELTFRELEKLAPNNPALQVEIVNQSVMRGWQGVFAMKGPVQANHVAELVLSRNAETTAAVLAARQRRRMTYGNE